MKGTATAAGEWNSARTNQQVVLNHVLDIEMRMDVAGFKDALNTLVAYKYPHRELDGGLKDLIFNYLLVRPELEGIKQMAWLKAKDSAILAEAPMQCAAVRIQAIWRGKRRLWLYRVKQTAGLRLHIWVRMVVKHSQYRSKLRRLEALRVAALQNNASTIIQRLTRQRIWLHRFGEMCCRRRQESLRWWGDWRAAKRRERRTREQAIVFRQSRSLNGCMVMITTSRKRSRTLDLHVKAYVPITQETFRFDIDEDELQYRLCRALNTDSLSGNEVLANLELVAASLSCRKQSDGRRWVVSMAKRVAAEAGTLVHREIRQLDGVIYCFKIYRSSTNIAVTAYEPRRCETLRTAVPIRGSCGLAVWIKWEVEANVWKRRRQLMIRLSEAHKTLKLNELRVEVPQPKLFAAKRLFHAVAQRIPSVAAAEATTAMANAPFADPEKPASVSSASAGQEVPLGVETVFRQGKATGAREPRRIGLANVAPATSLTNISTSAWTLQSASMHYASNSGEPKASDASCPDPQLTGMGPLPFAWYDGSVDDLEMFGAEPLETDELASTPNIDITVRGREVTLAQWILCRLKVERVQIERMELPTRGDDRGDEVGGGGNREGAEDGRSKTTLGPKKVVKWERVLVTSYEVEKKRRDLAASRVQGLSRMRRAREAARAKVFSQFEKYFDVDSGAYYYHSSKTGVSTFAKPRVLRTDQDLEDPSDDWIKQRDHLGRPFYINPATGQRSWLSVPEAAIVIVRACRRYLRAFFGIPSREAVERGLRFAREAEESWKRGGGRLASTLNYALVLHTHNHDLDAAGPLFYAALKMSSENPLVQRVCGLFLLASCRFPRDETRRKGLKLLNAANYRDRDLDTFTLAEQAFYHFGLILRPTHSKALLNWALVLEHVRRDADQAEKFYRRALAANDLDPLVLANCSSFYLERLPGGAYPGGGPGSRVLRRSRLEEDSLEWEGWERYRDPKASEACLSTFWLHSLLQETRWKGPEHEVAERS